MTPKQRKKRKAEIAAVIAKTRKEGRYDAVEHQTSLLDLDGVSEAWIEEGFDGVKALKRAWGKVSQIRYDETSVKVYFLSGNHLHLNILRGYTGPLLGKPLFRKLVKAGLVEGLEK